MIVQLGAGRFVKLGEAEATSIWREHHTVNVSLSGLIVGLAGIGSKSGSSTGSNSGTDAGMPGR
jgi:hypothetical protein